MVVVYISEGKKDQNNGTQEVYDYFCHYDKDTYQVVACMGNEPSEEDVQDFETQ